MGRATLFSAPPAPAPAPAPLVVVVDAPPLVLEVLEVLEVEEETMRAPDLGPRAPEARVGDREALLLDAKLVDPPPPALGESVPLYALVSLTPPVLMGERRRGVVGLPPAVPPLFDAPGWRGWS